MTNSDVGVVVPVFNRAQTVLDALESIAAQTLLPKRVVIVDDGSSDGTSESVRAWIDRRALAFEVQLIRQPNRGAPAARNRGLAEVMDCPLVAFLDSDDLWPSDFLERTVAALVGDPAAVAVSVDERYYGDARGHSMFRCLAPIARGATEWLFRNDGGITPATLMRTVDVCAVGAYDEQDHTVGDWRLFLKLSLRGRWLYAAGEPVTVRLGIPESRGESGQLHRSQPDFFLRAAELLEAFAVGEGRPAQMPPAIYVPVLADVWYRAGRECMRRQLPRKAISCFRRSKAWQLRPMTYFRIAENIVWLATASANGAAPELEMQAA